MRIIYIRSPTHGRPDPQRHARRRGSPRRPRGSLRSLRELNAPRETVARFAAARCSWPQRSPCTSSSPLALHEHAPRSARASEPEPIIATMIESPQRRSRTAARYTRRRRSNVMYSLPTPQELTFETSDQPRRKSSTAAIARLLRSHTAPPPMVESVEYVRAPAPRVSDRIAAQARTRHRACCACWSMRSAAPRRSRSNARAVTSASTPPRAKRWRKPCSVRTK